jgi:hypothetical protein
MAFTSRRTLLGACRLRVSRLRASWLRLRGLGIACFCEVGIACVCGVLDGRSSAEAVALVILDQLVIGEALLVQFGLLVSDLRPLALAFRLLLRRSGATLGLFGSLLTRRCVLAILTDDTFPSPAELSFTSPDARALT